jgi:hypothetical protein
VAVVAGGARSSQGDSYGSDRKREQVPLKMEGTLMDHNEALEVVGRMTESLRVFVAALVEFENLEEQEVPAPVFGDTRLVRWWRGRGWDLLRTADGVWLGFPYGSVVHPPFYAQLYPKMSGSIIAEVDTFKGFVLPRELPFSAVFEDKLCHLQITGD